MIARVSLFLSLALAASACGGSPPPPPLEDGPYAGIPQMPATGPIAEAQPIVPTGDPDLDGFLAELAAAIDRRDWLGVAQRMDPQGFVDQRELLSADGTPDAGAQVIAETLGIGSLIRDGAGWDGLDRVDVVTFRRHAVQTPGIAGGEARDLIEGTVRLSDGTTLPISFSIVSRGGTHVVLVPLG